MRVKLLGDAQPVMKHSAGAAGIDLCAHPIGETLIILPGQVMSVGTGVCVAIPDFHMGLLCLRSSGYKKRVMLANNVGIIDSDYRGEIRLMLYNWSTRPVTIHKGDRLAQLIVLPVSVQGIEYVDNLDITDRGSGGFGSTG